jgi:hypothetical protein
MFRAEHSEARQPTGTYEDLRRRFGRARRPRASGERETAVLERCLARMHLDCIALPTHTREPQVPRPTTDPIWMQPGLVQVEVARPRLAAEGKAAGNPHSALRVGMAIGRVRLPRGLARNFVSASGCCAVACNADPSSIATIPHNVGRWVFCPFARRGVRQAGHVPQGESASSGAWWFFARA